VAYDWERDRVRTSMRNSLVSALGFLAEAVKGAMTDIGRYGVPQALGETNWQIGAMIDTQAALDRRRNL